MLFRSDECMVTVTADPDKPGPDDGNQGGSTDTAHFNITPTRLDLKTGGEPAAITAAFTGLTGSEPEVVWTMEDAGVASVTPSTGKSVRVTANNVGGTKVIASTTINGNAVQATCIVTVESGLSMRINERNVMLDEGGKRTLTAYVSQEGLKTVWESDDEEIATINEETGALEAVSPGIATITASVKNENGAILATDSVEVTVSGVVLSYVDKDKNEYDGKETIYELMVGESIILKYEQFGDAQGNGAQEWTDRKSTRLNSSH